MISEIVELWISQMVRHYGWQRHFAVKQADLVLTGQRGPALHDNAFMLVSWIEAITCDIPA